MAGQNNFVFVAVYFAKKQKSVMRPPLSLPCPFSVIYYRAERVGTLGLGVVPKTTAVFDQCC